jgi:transposase
MTSVPKVNSTGGLAGALSSAAGAAQAQKNVTLNTFFASVAVGAVVFAVEFILFVVIKGKLNRIYIPKTYLVPERQRMDKPPKGIFSWLPAVFRTSNSEFIQKSGLDAYFFLRFLRMLLKIFVPLLLLIFPILLPLNLDNHWPGANPNAGLSKASWGNIPPTNTNRYWAHLILAIIVVIWACYVFYDELRGYIRLRQAYLTSPQHRLRASATTVLVSSIPRKWISVEALEGLFDVYPGGIRNIWLNRNFDELADKVKWRNRWATALEQAETKLIRQCKRAHADQVKKEAKKAKQSKEQIEHNKEAAAQAGRNMAFAPGISSGDPFENEQDQLQLEPTDSRGKSRFGKIVGGVGSVGHNVKGFGHNVMGSVRRKRTASNKNGQSFDSAEGSASIPESLLASGGPDIPDTVREQSRGRPEDEYYTAASAQDALHRAMTANTDDEAPPTPLEKDDRFAHGGPSDTNDFASALSPIVASEESGSQTVQHETGDTRERSESASEAKKDIGKMVLRGGAGSTKDIGGEPPKWQFWKRERDAYGDYSSPAPKVRVSMEDTRPLGHSSPLTDESLERQNTAEGRASVDDSIHTKKTNNTTASKTTYPDAFDTNLEDDEGEPVWKKYIKEGDRDTIRLPIFKLTWWPGLPWIGKKVDTIYYCRKEVARLNVEIEQDQQEPEKYPLMSSAFIQFNHQVAAHMACQSLAHHIPNEMSPRVVEISPEDVIWDNMRVRWWENYIRTGVVVAIIVALIIGWAVPVAFIALVSQIKFLTGTLHWLDWLNNLPSFVIGIIQGVLPPALLAALLAILPLLLRFMARQQGVQTGAMAELSVQNYYFTFLFVQVFLVVSISSSITSVIGLIIKDPTYTPTLLARNLPYASNFFFNYMILQAFSVSGGALVQVGSLIGWFIMAPLFDDTAREKWKRQTNLSTIKWGTFFPVYTNLAAIGIVYSVISPLILIFNVITFSLFWLIYRYNTLYVTQFKRDTGGLLFPKAINQLFVGIYFMEICMIGLFFLVRDNANKVACLPQGIIMIVITVITVIYQILLNMSFGPLFKYLPITLEDDAVQRDEEFANSLSKRGDQAKIAQEEHEGDDLNDVLEERERRERSEDRHLEEEDNKDIEKRRSHHKRTTFDRLDPRKIVPGTGRWAQDSRSRSAQRLSSGDRLTDGTTDQFAKLRERARKARHDLETQQIGTVGTAHPEDNLFVGMSTEIEDLTVEERDALVQRAFQHEALRARRPVVWIPRDELGVSDDEIYRTQRLSKHIWISNDYCGLDEKARVIYKRSPPDFSEVDLIEL